MSELSKQALKVENNTSFPNNNSGEISAADLRAFNVDMIDSLVDQITYNVDSASWNQQITALEQFTSSQQPSFTALNQFTASQLTINSGVNAFTQSANGRLTALESETANLEAFTASVNQIADNGVVQGTSTRLHFYGLVSASIVPNVNGPIASILIEQDGTKLNSASFNAYTASTDSDLASIHQTTQSLNNFTASLATAFVSTASFNSFTQSINSYTSSNNDKWSNLGSQSGSWVTESESGSFLITASFNNGTRNLTFTKGDASTFAVNIPDVSGSAGNFVTTSSFNAYTSSNDQRVSSLEAATASYAISSSVAAVDAAQQAQINALINATASYATSAITASSLITASFAAGTLTFTKGNGTQFGVVIPDVSGSTIDTGSFAITGSNIFKGNQSIDGNVLISGSDLNHLLFTRQGGSDILSIGVSDNAQTYEIKLTGSVNQTMWLIDNQGGTRINTFAAPVIAADWLRVESTFTASLQQGYAYVGNASGKTSAVATSSFVGTTINTASFATTGSNVFTGDQTLVDAAGNSVTLSDASGSLMLVAKTFTSASSHLTASANSFTNLIFKNNNNTADTIISGSNNLFVNPAAPTAGFKRFVGTTGNIELNASNVPQMSGSMAFPVTMNNNILTGNGTTLFMRGPISSSAWTIAGNIIGANTNIGNTAANNAEKVVAGLTMNNNILYGALTLVANRSTHTQIDAITNNIAMGGMTINANSSSIIHGSNIGNGGMTVNNNFFTTNPTAIANSGNNISTLRNTFTGIAHVVNFSGSGILATDGRTPTVQDNVVAGSTNTLFVGADTANNRSSLQSTAIIGFNLIVTGSSDIVTATDIGGGFIGRYNAVDGNRALSSQTVFAIGTGNSGSAGIVRKTGFLIDSGSNTFIEGTLNVSGSSTLSGSLYIQSASANLPAQTGSAVLTYNPTTGQIGQASYIQLLSASFDVGGFQTNNTKSGSAGVSQSIDFEITDVSKGITIVSNTQATVQNSGTYLLIFSAQLECSAGADTVWIWLKKNGTNVPESATKSVMQNNTAQTMTVNFMLELVANDYIEVVWQNNAGNARILAEAASGNYPAIPAVILTINQIH